ncbi:MAG: hypothetical protein M1837_000208 [Sclerophora amabilis]|nr:MAG: hypothetical protein M1837_000208 [Sclerophora amabilis]
MAKLLRCFPGAGNRQWIDHFWARNVSVVISADDDLRNYYALERTFLAYIRTSIALSLTAVMVTQFYVLSDNGSNQGGFTFHSVGKPLACTLVGISIVVALVGLVRYLRQQAAMVLGKALTGGGDLLLIGVLFCLVRSVSFSAFAIAAMFSQLPNRSISQCLSPRL